MTRSAVDSLAAALYGYLAIAEPVTYDFGGKPYSQPCSENDLDVRHFRQSWPNTATMFTRPGGISGQAFTDAWTTAIGRGNTWRVYCDGRACYSVTDPNKEFLADLAAANLADQGRAAGRYHGTE